MLCREATMSSWLGLTLILTVTLTKVSVVRDGVELGRARCEMAQRVGRFRAPLLDSAGKPTGAMVTCTYLAPPTA